jgi:hypothetical protein
MQTPTMLPPPPTTTTLRTLPQIAAIVLLRDGNPGTLKTHVSSPKAFLRT